jgi:hypothetical protein
MIDFLTTIIQPIPSHTYTKKNLTNLKIGALATAIFTIITLLQLSYFAVAIGGVATASLLGKVILYGVGIATYAAYAIGIIVSGVYTLISYNKVKIDRIHDQKIDQINNDLGQLLDDAQEYFGMEKEEDRQDFLKKNPQLAALFCEAKEEERKNYNAIAQFIGKLREEAISQIA